MADRYLLEVSRFLHFNPVRGKVFGGGTPIERRDRLRGYRWSSYRGYVTGHNLLEPGAGSKPIRQPRARLPARLLSAPVVYRIEKIEKRWFEIEGGSKSRSFLGREIKKLVARAIQ